MKRALWLSVLLLIAGPAGRASEEPASLETAWRMVEGCLDDPQLAPGLDVPFEQVWPRMQECREASRVIAIAGNDGDREHLWSVFERVPERSQLADDVLDALLDWHVAAALAHVEHRPTPASAPPEPAALEAPPFLVGATDDLKRAWRLYQGMSEFGADTRGTPQEERISYQSNPARFRRTLADFLRDRLPAAQAIDELQRYEWGGWCGMGSNLLHDPQSKALVIASLRLGRPDLALAATAGVGGGFGGAENAVERWDRRLLIAAGVDWERFHLGGVLSGDLSLASDLGSRGSERAARQLLAAVPILESAPDFHAPFETLAWALAAFVEADGACRGTGSGDSRQVDRDPESEPIGVDIQAAVLDLLEGRVGPQAGLREAETASLLLAERCRPESLMAFRTMLRSPYDEVRQRGATGLRALGETLSDPQRSRPVAFRLRLDGRSSGRRTLNSVLQLPSWEQSTEVESDDRGIVELPRDPFLDPRDRLKAVRVETPDIRSASDLWFSASVEPPSDLDTVRTISVRTGALTIIVPEELLQGPGERPRLEVMAEMDRYGVEDTAMPIGAVPLVSARITFPRLQHGRYSVWVHHGGRMYQSGTVEVGPRAATVTVHEEVLDPEIQQLLTREE
jgi:hypothetical protein